MAKRVHSSMANKPRQKCCPSVASLPARAAAERAGRERTKSFAVHDVNYNSSKTSAALALGTHTQTLREREGFHWESGAPAVNYNYNYRVVRGGLFNVACLFLAQQQRQNCIHSRFSFFFSFFFCFRALYKRSNGGSKQWEEAALPAEAATAAE